MSLKIDGIAASSALDSSGEILEIEGLDISDFIEGRGVLNWEHDNKHENTVGAIVYAKKILQKSDCENDRQRRYWDSVKKPFVYIIGELFDDEDHPGAIAIAAMIRYYSKKSEKMLVGFSIEGSTLERDGNMLKQAIARRCAITIKPANKTAIADIYEDEKVKKLMNDMEKSQSDVQLFEVDSFTLEDKEVPYSPYMEIHKAIEDLNKTLTAGMGNVAPSQLVGGAALVREQLSGTQKNKVKAALRDWDKRTPLKQVIKNVLPEIGDKYVEHFTDLAEDLMLKKSMQNPAVRLSSKHGHTPLHPEQNELIEGLQVTQDLDKMPVFKPKHDLYGSAIYKGKNDKGQTVLIKSPEKDKPEDLHNFAQKASMYHGIAKSVFGLGDNVPETAAFKHESLKNSNKHHGDWFQAIEHKKDTKTPLEDQKGYNAVIATPEGQDKLSKLLIMDHILGGRDRHAGNILFDKKGELHLIDNDRSFDHYDSDFLPSETHEEIMPENGFLISDDTANWIKKVDPKILLKTMLDHGIHHDTAKKSILKLKAYQKMAKKGYNIKDLIDKAHMSVSAAPKEKVK
jgi:hypothetical protein